MLRWVEPYIAYGYPNLKSVRDLVYKRGFGKTAFFARLRQKKGFETGQVYVLRMPSILACLQADRIDPLKCQLNQ